MQYLTHSPFPLATISVLFRMVSRRIGNDGSIGDLIVILAPTGTIRDIGLWRFDRDLGGIDTGNDRRIGNDGRNIG